MKVLRLKPGVNIPKTNVNIPFSWINRQSNISPLMVKK